MQNAASSVSLLPVNLFQKLAFIMPFKPVEKPQEIVPQVLETGCKPVLFVLYSSLFFPVSLSLSIYCSYSLYFFQLLYI